MTYDESIAGYVPEEVPVEIYDADKFPPRFYVGQRVRFLFRLAKEKPFSLSGDKKTINVNYEAEALAIVTKGGDQPVAAMSNGEQPTLRFQRADSRVGKTNDGNPIPSRLHRLYRALVGRVQAKITGSDPQLIVEALKALDGRETFEATIGWKHFDADTQTEWSTGTSKERTYTKPDGTVATYMPWPTEGGRPMSMVDGEYPREFIATCIEKKVVGEAVSA